MCRLSSPGHLTKDCPPGWGLDGGLTSHLREEQQITKMLHMTSNSTYCIELCQQREMGLGYVTWKV